MRYRLYGEWEKEDERIPMVLAARQTAKVSNIYFSRVVCDSLIHLHLPSFHLVFCKANSIKALLCYTNSLSSL